MKIKSKSIGMVKGREVISFELIGRDGFQVNILSYGGIITDIIAPDREGRLENVVLKYMEISTYEKNPSYLGAIIGRTSGRICEGEVELEDREIEFDKNFGLHHGHGGKHGLSRRFWKYRESSGDDRITLHLSCISPDGEGNYPGNLMVRADYTVTDKNELIIGYYGISDKTTLLNLTNHSYFNLSGNVKDSILNHELYIDGEYILELDGTGVPTGRAVRVDSTPFDFRKPEKIGVGMESGHELIKACSGYDHPWLLNAGDGAAIRLRHEDSGRVMEVYTNQKCVVVYSMNFPDENPLSTGRPANKRDAVCFETQSPPIGRNQSFLEESILRPGEEYRRETTFRFYTE